MWNKPLKHSNHRTLVRKPSHLISFHGNFFESLFGTFCCKSHRIYMHGKNPAYALCIHLGVGEMLIKVSVTHLFHSNQKPLTFICMLVIWCLWSEVLHWCWWWAIRITKLQHTVHKGQTHRIRLISILWLVCYF